MKEPRATLQTDLEIPVLRRDQAAGPPLPDGRLDGLGPYIVKENTAQGIVLAGRSNAALPRPNHNLSIRYVHDENARAVRLLAGRSDIVPNGVSPSLVSTLEKQGAIANSRPGANLTYLLIHNQRPPFDNPEVRKAAAMAIDRGLLVNTLFGGHAKVANTFWPLEQIPDGVKNEILAQTLPLFDPNAARQIVDKLPNKTINLLTSTERSRALQGRIMAQMLRDVGFEVNVSTLDLGAMLHRLSKGDFELALLQMPELTEPNVLRWFFHSDSIPGQGRAGANRARFSDSTVDSLFDRAAVLTDIEERWALYSRALRRMNEQLPVIPLFHEDQIALVSQRAAGFSLSAEGRWLDVAFLP